MLRLFTGRAGTGKTAAVINEIHTAVLEKQGRRLLIVPEQYSHEAERELCRVCGDSMSLYAEVMSFTGLARRIASQQGGGAAPYLDKGGRLLEEPVVNGPSTGMTSKLPLTLPEYYEARGWVNAFPTDETLKKLGLDECVGK